MVAGLERFREHFRGLERAFVIIGGAACDAWMSRNGLPFRKTKDLDIVLVIEALDPAFIGRFREFVQAGRYEIRQRQETGRREFYRFVKPKAPAFPFMLELFSRAPAGLELVPGQEVAPVAVEDAVASLSAILMDEGYYDLVQATRYDADGIPMVGVAGLIPLKARAWLDLHKRRIDGGTADDDDVRKHRNDVFRLALTLPGTGGPVVADGILASLRAFLAAFPEDASEWVAIDQALRGTVRSPPSPAELRQAISTYFRLG
jgi:hypothetical protein